MRDAFISKLEELCANDPTILLVTGDLGFGVFDSFRENFPDQFINAGIAEQNMMGLAAGLGLEGYKVFTYSIANFPTLRCLEQLRNDAAYHESNVTVVSIGGGFSYGALGMSHHATEDLSIMRAFPIDIAVPNDIRETTLITNILAKSTGTSYLRLDKDKAELPSNQSVEFHFGKPTLLYPGNDATIISCGGITSECISAVQNLKQHGISCRLLTAHSIRPFDFSMVVEAVNDTGILVTVEENTVHGGFGGYIAENLLEMGCLPRKFKRIGLKNGFSSVVGSQHFLRKYYQMDSEFITNYILDACKDRKY